MTPIRNVGGTPYLYSHAGCLWSPSVRALATETGDVKSVNKYMCTVIAYTSYIIKKLIPTSINSLNMRTVHIIAMPRGRSVCKARPISLLKRICHIHLRHPLLTPALLPSLSSIAFNSSPFRLPTQCCGAEKTMGGQFQMLSCFNWLLMWKHLE